MFAQIAVFFVILGFSSHGRRLQSSVKRWSQEEVATKPCGKESLSGAEVIGTLLLTCNPPAAFHFFGPGCIGNAAPSTARSGSVEAKKKQKNVVSQEKRDRLKSIHKELAALASGEPCEEGCTTCVGLLDELRENEFPMNGNSHNQAMRACVRQLPIVERLFAEVSEQHWTSEGSYAALLQAQTEHGELQKAIETLHMMLDHKGMSPKLRTFAPLLHRLLDVGNATASAQIWTVMMEHGVDFSPREFDARLRMHARHGDWPALRRCISEFLNKFPTPDEASIDALRTSVQDCTKACEGEGTSDVAVVSLDGENRCTKTGQQLRCLGLTAAQRKRMRDVLLERASGSFQLEHFCKWLRERPPFDYVLDGPNIAYNNQNFADGRFAYRQVQDIIDCILQREPNARVLILMPEKYVRRDKIFCVTTKKEQNLTLEDKELIRSWKEAGMLYTASRGLYDDWFWMMATVAETQSSGHSTGNEPLLGVTRAITNDDMHDHHVELLPPLEFRRWMHSQVLSFGVLEFNSTYQNENKGEESSEFLRMRAAGVTGPLRTWVAPVPRLSVEAQSHGSRWHVPINGTNPQKWLYFSVPEDTSRNRRKKPSRFLKVVERNRKGVDCFRGHESHSIDLHLGFLICKKCGARCKSNGQHMRKLSRPCDGRPTSPYFKRALAQLTKTEKPLPAKAPPRKAAKAPPGKAMSSSYFR